MYDLSFNISATFTKRVNFSRYYFSNLVPVLYTYIGGKLFITKPLFLEEWNKNTILAVNDNFEMLSGIVG